MSCRPAASAFTLPESLVHHVALPPRLPGEAESQLGRIEAALTDLLSNASRTVRDLTNDALCQTWESTRHILQISKALNAGGKLDKASLVNEFGRLSHGEILILHVAEQNAGLLIRRHKGSQGNVVEFEAFEASPLSENVLATQNALQWDFPGCAVAIPYSTFADASFQDELAGFLEQASTESIKRFAAHTYKARSFAFESRDTVDPSIITQMLMTVLEVHGHRIIPPTIRKRVRDDVIWSDGAERPWRRCPYWLVLRVGVERHLRAVHGNDIGRLHYKFLMCLVLVCLIEEALKQLSPESSNLLTAKLSRRLVKIEVDRCKAPASHHFVYESMFAALGPLFRRTTKRAHEHLEAVWNGFKLSIRRSIRPVPRQASRADLFMTLPNSGSYIEQVLSWRPQMESAYQEATQFDRLAATNDRSNTFAVHYLELARVETQIEESQSSRSIVDHETNCINISETIYTYLSTVGNSYDSNPEQKSTMLLAVMKLWMSLDQCATKLFPLLLEYNPSIPPGILDVLQLPSLVKMSALRDVQQYLQVRHAQCDFSRRSIFDDPCKGCFGERYFDESNDSQRLQEIYRNIETKAEIARSEKEKEWKRMCVEYETLEKQIAESTCLYTTAYSNIRVNEHVDEHRNCTKCYLRRKARRMRIDLHEHPLPWNIVQAKAAVFELGCSKAFKAYRNATWKIVGGLACSTPIKSSEPQLTLQDYSELRKYMKERTAGVSLASTTKSFLLTHYNSVHFPVSLDKVCVQNGLKLRYFDTLANVWLAHRPRTPTFAHHCWIGIPANSPFSSLQSSPNFLGDSNGPTSHEIIASQSKCPTGLNVHEFTAYQTLFSGKNRRWLSILVELGSSNLNFSTESTVLLVTQLALQAGPSFELDPLRTIHRVFRDEPFCKRLIEQISRRLEDISSSWRRNKLHGYAPHCDSQGVFAGDRAYGARGTETPRKGTYYYTHMDQPVAQ